MKSGLKSFSPYRLWSMLPRLETSHLPDALMFAAVLSLFYGTMEVARTWWGPFTPRVEISHSLWALPVYAGYSLLRISVAYFLSLTFTLVYGYIAAYNPTAERFMVPLLDVLQSIPVLSFLPGVMLAMVALFPSRQLGVELGAVLLIFTGQVWNMAFSFYASLKSIPREMREAASIYRFSWWQRFWRLELPSAAIGLIWNSMMSVAGGWFFLMACEMFVLGNRDFRLPGLGSYLQTAANAGNTKAICLGLATMIGVIIVIDQLIWRPVIAWADKFKLEQVAASEAPRSPILALLRSSKLLPYISRALVLPIRQKLDSYFVVSKSDKPHGGKNNRGTKLVLPTLTVIVMAGIVYAVFRLFAMLSTISFDEVRHLFWGAGATFVRVEVALLFSALWTVPVGVAVGLRPRLSAIAQPIAQIAASVPATALFPIILLLLIRAGGGIGTGSILLLVLGTQWYVLFNVIAGASAIPEDLKEVCDTYRLGKAARWQTLLLPGIFPYLITGLVTASGGAWNASIVAEYFHFRGEMISTTGLGAIISQATDAGNFRLLLAATVVMALIVVSINRLVWRRLYSLATTRYKLEV